MTSTATKCIVSILPLLLLFVLILHYHSQDKLKISFDSAIDRITSSTLAGIANFTTPSLDFLPTVYNSCEREWVLPPHQNWPVLKTKKSCANVQSETPYFGICRVIAGKRLLFVGPDTTYHLHSIWLQSLESHERRSHLCLGRDYCTFHHICRPFSPEGVEDAKELVGRKKKFPNRSTLLSYNSSVLQYAHSTTLYASSNKHDEVYNYPTVDTSTGIRIDNTFWIRQARKADIIILNRGPVPAPRSTYPTGDWTFAKNLCNVVNHMRPMPCGDDLEHLLANAALHATISSFLPALVRTLRVMSNDQEIKNSFIVWHSSWFIQPLCATSALPKNSPLVRDIYSNSKIVSLIDPWSLYYNSQVHIHGRILPKLLARYNITYLSLAVPGYPGYSHMRIVQKDLPHESHHVKDCIRHPWSTFAENMLEEVFFKDMISLLNGR